jgi:hypothetical protein
MSPKSHGAHVRKVCRCGWRQWPKCPHAWYFSFKPPGGRRYRFSLDAELGQHLESKTGAENAASRIRNAILDGTFECAADRSARARQPTTPQSATNSDSITFDAFAQIYINRVAKASGKASWKDDAYLLATVCRHRTPPMAGDWGTSP